MIVSHKYQVKAFLLGAGLGTRLRPLTDQTPKCLLPIGGKPLLQIWLENLSASGVAEVLINTHWLHDQVEAFLREWNHSALKITTFYEPHLLGSAGTIFANKDWIQGASEILILYADNLTTVNLNDVLSFHRSHSYCFTLGVFESRHPERCGIVQLTPEGVVTEFVEKPVKPITNLAAGGIYVADPSFVRELPGPLVPGKAYDLGTDVLPKMVGNMKALHLQGLLLDIGTPEAYREAQQIYAEVLT